MTQKIEINLAYEQEQVFDAIVRTAAGSVTDGLVHEIRKEVRERVTGVIDAQINNIVADLLAKEFTPVDAFGEASGTPTTIRAILSKKAETFLQEKVDSQGRAVDRNSYTATTTRSQWLLGQMYGEAINSQAKADIKRIAEEAKAKAHESVARLLVATLAKD